MRNRNRAKDRDQTINDLYDRIRAKADPDWQGIGFYCGSGVWLDPDAVGQRGEIEYQPALARSLAQSLGRPARRPLAGL